MTETSKIDRKRFTGMMILMSRYVNCGKRGESQKFTIGPYSRLKTGLRHL